MNRIAKTAGVAGLLMAGTLLAGCGRLSMEVPPAPPPQSMPATQIAPGKRIVRDGNELVLPDGTRVPTDARGGFTLPNGDYVARDANGALVLPTGARCLPDPGGYVCP
ncbi:hypothetical protein [Bosea sp. BH3]|uniref:hypothetical protein n=1 Tax=Bosea sp. BH3 TaxID=2871701 RepID=UPI0021CB2D98|nr:hypothetical protein [Bosea sp. BH3]MCU4178168.1 hypothetical protein [Bosea sp. BH3]